VIGGKSRFGQIKAKGYREENAQVAIRGKKNNGPR